MRSYIDTEGQEALRKSLVSALQAKGIASTRVLEVMERVPRQFFLPEALADKAYLDRPLPIGKGQTISQPFTVAYQSQLLDVQCCHRVLEVGTGSAYQAVILAELAREVYSVERQKSLFERNQHFPYLKVFGNLHLFYGDGFEGLQQFAPFDRILLTAAAPVVPQALVEQLAIGGKLIVPLGRQRPQQMVRLTKGQDGSILKESFGAFQFVPMLPGTEEK